MPGGAPFVSVHATPAAPGGPQLLLALPPLAGQVQPPAAAASAHAQALAAAVGFTGTLRGLDKPTCFRRYDEVAVVASAATPGAAQAAMQAAVAALLSAARGDAAALTAALVAKLKLEVALSIYRALDGYGPIAGLQDKGFSLSSVALGPLEGPEPSGPVVGAHDPAAAVVPPKALTDAQQRALQKAEAVWTAASGLRAPEARAGGEKDEATLGEDDEAAEAAAVALLTHRGAPGQAASTKSLRKAALLALPAEGGGAYGNTGESAGSSTSAGAGAAATSSGGGGETWLKQVLWGPDLHATSAGVSSSGYASSAGVRVTGREGLVLAPAAAGRAGLPPAGGRAPAATATVTSSSEGGGGTNGLEDLLGLGGGFGGGSSAVVANALGGGGGGGGGGGSVDASSSSSSSSSSSGLLPPAPDAAGGDDGEDLLFGFGSSSAPAPAPVIAPVHRLPLRVAAQAAEAVTATGKVTPGGGAATATLVSVVTTLRFRYMFGSCLPLPPPVAAAGLPAASIRVVLAASRPLDVTAGGLWKPAAIGGASPPPVTVALTPLSSSSSSSPLLLYAATLPTAPVPAPALAAMTPKTPCDMGTLSVTTAATSLSTAAPWVKVMARATGAAKNDEEGATAVCTVTAKAALAPALGAAGSVAITDASLAVALPAASVWGGPGASFGALPVTASGGASWAASTWQLSWASAADGSGLALAPGKVTDATATLDVALGSPDAATGAGKAVDCPLLLRFTAAGAGLTTAGGVSIATASGGRGEDEEAALAVPLPGSSARVLLAVGEAVVVPPTTRFEGTWKL